MSKNKKLIIVLIIGIVLFALSFFEYYGVRQQSIQRKTNYATSQDYLNQIKDYYSYQGENGKDALTLLQSKAKVELATSGLVTSINGRKASDKKHEYWAFYVNGKLASVGPKDYVTRSGEKIEWKIANY